MCVTLDCGWKDNQWPPLSLSGMHRRVQWGQSKRSSSITKRCCGSILSRQTLAESNCITTWVFYSDVCCSVLGVCFMSTSCFRRFHYGRLVFKLGLRIPKLFFTRQSLFRMVMRHWILPVSVSDHVVSWFSAARPTGSAFFKWRDVTPQRFVRTRQSMYWKYCSFKGLI